MKNELFELVTHLEKSVPYAAALYKKSAGTRVNVNRVQESIEPVDPLEGLVFTLWNGQCFYEYALNRWNWAELKTTLSDVARYAKDQLNSARPLTDIDPGAHLNKDFSNPVAMNPDLLSPQEKLNRAKNRMQEALDTDPQVANVFSIQSDVTTSDIFVNRHKMLSQTITRVEVMLLVFISDGKKTVEIYDGVSKNGGLEAADLPHNAIVNLVQDGKRLLGAERLAPGVYDIVTHPDWSGIIAHECFGHGMETDLYVRDRALSRRYIGKPVASPLVNMFDDPSLMSEAGGFYFDDEGQPAERTHIIENGILRRGLTDMASAHKLSLARSANGRRESYARKAYARMTNTFFGGGASNRNEMISSVENGLYLRYATNGMEDPQAWGIQVEGLWAEEIKNGRLTGTVYSPVIMTGFVPDLLASISMVGNDVDISGLGICGKGHKEWVKNTTGGPHLKMKARLG
jgi:TldD protein